MPIPQFLVEALQQFMEGLKEDLVNNIPSVSGKTRDAIRTEVSSGETLLTGSIFGPKYIGALEHGRGPTRGRGKGGGQSLRENLLEWIKARGIQPTGKIKTQEQLSWAMAVKIHNEGNRLFRRGGKSGVLTNVFKDDRIESFVQTWGNEYTRLIKSEILKK